MAKKMGTNPLTGINGLIRSTQEPLDEPLALDELIVHYTQDVLITHVDEDTHDTPQTQGRKGQKLPRINMAFAPDLLEYLQAISGFERVSATQYVNGLIREDKKKRAELYGQLNALRTKN